jgi:nucleotide-binding universal stress UspA family protein
MHVLVCCKEPNQADALLRPLIRLNLPSSSPVTLLTVTGKSMELHPLAQPIPDGFAWPLVRKVRRGAVIAEILAEVAESKAELVVCGRSSHRAPLGSTTQRLIRACPVDLLLVRPIDRPLARALVCTGGETPSLATLRSAAAILNRTHIQVGILHVMSQIAFSNASPHADLVDTADTAMARGTHEGTHLRQATEAFAAAEFQGGVFPLLRHGLVVDEVLAELRQGKYDLLAIGSRPPRTTRRWSDLLMEDVGADLASRAQCSVLLIRPPVS